MLYEFLWQLLLAHGKFYIDIIRCALGDHGLVRFTSAQDRLYGPEVLDGHLAEIHIVSRTQSAIGVDPLHLWLRIEQNHVTFFNQCDLFPVGIFKGCRKMTRLGFKSLDQLDDQPDRQNEEGRTHQETEHTEHVVIFYK
jgi:hypothetical protein